MSRGFPLSSLPAQYQSQAAKQLYNPQGVARAQADASKPKTRLRQESRTVLNATEAAFLLHLHASFPGPGFHVTSQEIRLRLANGAWYKPDNVVFGRSGAITAYEVKGYMRPKDSLTLKVAAQQFPAMRFILVTKRDGGGWDLEGVNS